MLAVLANWGGIGLRLEVSPEPLFPLSTSEPSTGGFVTVGAQEVDGIGHARSQIL